MRVLPALKKGHYGPQTWLMHIASELEHIKEPKHLRRLVIAALGKMKDGYQSWYSRYLAVGKGMDQRAQYSIKM